VIALPAEIDMDNARQVRQQLYSALTPGAAVVVADMTATVFCDSTGVRALVMAHQHARAANAELRLAISSLSVLRVMAIMRLDSVLRIYPSLDVALAPPAGTERNQTE
jgi:anti-sigma B factor antagonist